MKFDIIKKTFKISIYSFVTFCVVNFTLLLIQIFIQSKTKEIPEIWIGFPINFFKLFINNQMNYTTRLDWISFFINFFIFWIIIFLYFSFKKHKQNH